MYWTYYQFTSHEDFLYQFWIHINEHLQVIWLICYTWDFQTWYAPTFDYFSSGPSSTLMRFQTTGIKFKTWRLPIFALVFVA